MYVRLMLTLYSSTCILKTRVNSFFIDINTFLAKCGIIYVTAGFQSQREIGTAEVGVEYDEQFLRSRCMLQDLFRTSL